ncbi:hypothetical protein [Deinococcus sp. 12RED42]|uniref:hypothetical protein n=1 Tax=Deinococcus sp. 12RED42 TaxID=2745872 RepID=UPI001E28B688|nr:hypothetical protein [Deinococcus sp. 12RED42]MCD0167279.1 hypothetical protein [Deinococcus sp. 12RED42]
MSSDRTYTLTVTGEQLRMISRACEVAARISIGQVDAVAFHLLASLPSGQYSEVQDALETAQTLITGAPNVSGAPNDQMRDQHELAWSIYHAARYRLYLDQCADDGRTPDRMTVMSDPPRPCGRHAPPAIAQAGISTGGPS